jgi:hypothetical protein
MVQTIFVDYRLTVFAGALNASEMRLCARRIDASAAARSMSEG